MTAETIFFVLYEDVTTYIDNVNFENYSENQKRLTDYRTSLPFAELHYSGNCKEDRKEKVSLVHDVVVECLTKLAEVTLKYTVKNVSSDFRQECGRR